MMLFGSSQYLVTITVCHYKREVFCYNDAKIDKNIKTNKKKRRKTNRQQ